MLSWIFYIVGFILSWHFADLNSTETIYNTVCPVMVGVFAIALFIKLTFMSGIKSHSSGSSSRHGGGFFGGSDGGGDCGGGDGGC